MREFAEDDGEEFSSFAQYIGLARCLDTIFLSSNQGDLETLSAQTVNFNASIMGWYSLLPHSKRKLLKGDGALDRNIFKANMVINT